MVMKYEMQFCVGCYLPDALALAQNLLESNPHDESFSLRLVPGESGSFEVKKDDQLVYSKKAKGRLPTPQDLGLASSAGAIPIVGQQSSGKCC
jgi:selT/selW/selH-like putative selenoprotein